MGKKTERLQILLPESDLVALREMSDRGDVSMAHIMRRALRSAIEAEAAGGGAAAAVQAATRASWVLADAGASQGDRVIQEIRSIRKPVAGSVYGRSRR